MISTLEIIRNPLDITGTAANQLNIALVAQLDRVSASEAECRVFESPRAHHFFFRYKFLQNAS